MSGKVTHASKATLEALKVERCVVALAAFFLALSEADLRRVFEACPATEIDENTKTYSFEQYLVIHLRSLPESVTLGALNDSDLRLRLGVICADKMEYLRSVIEQAEQASADGKAVRN